MERSPGSRGFTFIEIVVAMALASILMVGIVHVWSTVNGMYLRLVLRQRAVFALDSQTDRLTAVYRNCSGYDGSDGSAGLHTGAEACTAAFVVTQAVNFTNGGVGVDEGKVFYSSSNNTNDIFIDRQNMITARLSWRRNADSPACSALRPQLDFSANGAVCLEVSITYPYRWNVTAGAGAQDDSLGAAPETLTVLTVTGINPGP
jgi:prepilin-type N-terminal cleavage/methylation domain-containing protein